MKIEESSMSGVKKTYVSGSLSRSFFFIFKATAGGQLANWSEKLWKIIVIAN